MQSCSASLIRQFHVLHCRHSLRQIPVALVLWLGFTQFAMAQAPSTSMVEEKTLATEDGKPIKISYYKSTAGREAPIVVMLPGKRGNRLQWKELASELQLKRDFAVVTVDLRGHGESATDKAELKKSDYQAMAAIDMDAVRDFLLEEHQKGQLNIRKQGIVACDFSASVALVYTEIDWQRPPYDDSPNAELRTPRGQDVRALSLISPDVSTPGLLGAKAANALREYPIAVMIGASEKNAKDLKDSKKLYDQISVKRDKVDFLYFEKYQEDVRGMDLIHQDRQIRGHIIGFLDKYVKQLKVEWQDRRSRLDRD